MKAQTTLSLPEPPQGEPWRIAHLLCRNTANGRPGRNWECMTPSRYGHACELLEQGVNPLDVSGAINLVNASGWLKRPIDEITPAVFHQMMLDRPWERIPDGGKAKP